MVLVFVFRGAALKTRNSPFSRERRGLVRLWLQHHHKDKRGGGMWRHVGGWGSCSCNGLCWLSNLIIMCTMFQAVRANLCIVWNEVVEFCRVLLQTAGVWGMITFLEYFPCPPHHKKSCLHGERSKTKILSHTPSQSRPNYALQICKLACFFLWSSVSEHRCHLQVQLLELRGLLWSCLWNTEFSF